MQFIFLLSFITFPQILYDGFQAESANTSTSANQSLPSLEFVDILTADVSRKTHLFYQFSFDFANCASVISQQLAISIQKNLILKIPKNSTFLSFIACSLIARTNKCGSGKNCRLSKKKTKVDASSF